MKNILRLSLLFICLIVMVGCGKKDDNKLVMVTEAGFAPYEYYKNAEIVRQKKYLAAIEDLKVGKVDLVVMDELPAKEIIEKNSDIKILDGELTSDSYGMIVKKGNTELLETVNKVLNRLSSDGSIDNFIIKHTEE